MERLQRILDERGLLEFEQIEASRDELRRTAENERREWALKTSSFSYNCRLCGLNWPKQKANS
ncbi:hypothetical protein SB659_18785 [Arthrobacter sp. SIMBA_036]|uniref:hypothetical protein n=1 Tax=Arthrobacter sp. SIMBA_036 TaxID=3085778 RepID=UPI00397C44EC